MTGEATPTQERCSSCRSPLVVWTYRAATGDLMFNPRTGVPLVVIEGDTVQKRAALICATCDRLDLMPRSDRP